MVRMSTGEITHEPPTPEERARALAALERIVRRHQKLLAMRGGRYFPSAAEVVRELRGEQDEDMA